MSDNLNLYPEQYSVGNLIANIQASFRVAGLRGLNRKLAPHRIGHFVLQEDFITDAVLYIFF